MTREQKNKIEYRSKHKEKISEYNKAYYQAHKEYFREYGKKWREKNKGYWRRNSKIGKAKVEAIKEFAERLKEKMDINSSGYILITEMTLDNLVKELTEGK